MWTRKNANKINMPYQLVDEDKLTNEDKKKFYKLTKRIEKGESISEKFKKSSYDTKKLLTTKMSYKYTDVEGTLTLLCYAILYKKNQSFEMLLQEAIKHKILKDVLNDKLIQKLSDGRTITYTILVECISEKNSKAVMEVLESAKNNGILKEILNQKVKIEKAEGQETSYTLLDYANRQDDKEIASLLKEFEESLQVDDIGQTQGELTKIDTESREELTNNVTLESKATEADTQFCNSDGEDLQLEPNEEAQSPLIETSTTDNFSTTEIKPSFDSKSCRENSKGEKSPKNLPQSIAAGIVGAGLLASCITLYIMKMPVVAVALGIVGLTCAGFALYNLLKPKTKFEEMKDVEQHTAQPLRNLLCC